MDARFENHGDPGRPLPVAPHAEGVRLRLGDMGITDVSIVLTPDRARRLAHTILHIADELAGGVE